jgi:hypothetical protein
MRLRYVSFSSVQGVRGGEGRGGARFSHYLAGLCRFIAGMEHGNGYEYFPKVYIPGMWFMQSSELLGQTSRPRVFS